MAIVYVLPLLETRGIPCAAIGASRSLAAPATYGYQYIRSCVAPIQFQECVK